MPHTPTPAGLLLSERASAVSRCRHFENILVSARICAQTAPRTAITPIAPGRGHRRRVEVWRTGREAQGRSSYSQSHDAPGRGCRFIRHGGTFFEATIRQARADASP